MIRELTVHEAMPGHFLQLAHSRRFRAATRVRSLGWSGPFVEGWAVYAEELMAGLGFGGLPVRLQQLKMQLRMSINAILDQLVHCDGPARGRGDGPDDRPRLPGGGRGGRQVAAGAADVHPALHLLRRLHRGRGDRRGPAVRATPKAWHDAMLAHGSPPPRHLRTLLDV